MNRLLYAILFMGFFFAVPALHAANPSADDLRKAAQNPMANMMSFPFQNNTNFGYGPLEETQNITNIQRVIPFNLNENWLLISRTIAPLISQPGFYGG